MWIVQLSRYAAAVQSPSMFAPAEPTRDECIVELRSLLQFALSTSHHVTTFRLSWGDQNYEVTITMPDEPGDAFQGANTKAIDAAAWSRNVQRSNELTLQYAMTY